MKNQEKSFVEIKQIWKIKDRFRQSVRNSLLLSTGKKYINYMTYTGYTVLTTEVHRRQYGNRPCFECGFFHMEYFTLAVNGVPLPK